MKAIWKTAKTAIRTRIPEHSYKMWIEPLEVSQFKDNNVVLSCPNFFSKKRIQNQYGAIIASELCNAVGRDCHLELEVLSNKSNPRTFRSPDDADDIRLNRTSSNNLNKDGQRQLSLPDIRPRTGRILRKNFTFDKFVVGGNNDFAYSAALSLASQKSTTQNSLFLLSNTGMGKSHLSQAIGHHILNQFPSDRVLYITAEDFTNEMVYAFQNNTIEKFKQKFRRECDVLLLEDVHFLAGKERTQIELALAIDYLFEVDKKIIFTSCYLPTDIPKLSEQLRSRLLCGLISNIEAPDFRTRVRIIQKKSKENGYQIPEDVTEYLAGELSENVRQLESGLIGVAAKSSLLGAPIDLRLAESVVKNITIKQKTITIDVIKKVVCKNFSISVSDIVSKSRKQGIVRPRQIAIFLARKYTDQPLQAIGKSFNRQHATAIHAISAIEKEIKIKGPIQKQINYLCKKFDEGAF